MSATPVFGRIATAVITPFDSRGGIDYAAAKRLVEHLAANGSDAVVVAGTTGEGATLSAEERVELFKFWADSAPDGLKVVANTGTNVTDESVKLTQQATKAGVDGVMAVMPYYNKPNTDGQIRHFRMVAQATDKPVLMYNVPSRTGGSMTLEAIYQLSGVSNIAAIKEASGNLDFVSSIIKNSAHDFVVYSGDDSLTLPILAVGGVGVVSVASHIVGPQLAEMVQAYVKGEVDRAAKIHRDLHGVFKALFLTTNPIPVKTAMAMMGLVSENFRLPMTPAPEDVKNHLAAIMNEHGLFPGIPSK
jgi:4-hydroxy-tetrahydrodipicolinate synthase